MLFRVTRKKFLNLQQRQLNNITFTTDNRELCGKDQSGVTRLRLMYREGKPVYLADHRLIRNQKRSGHNGN